MLRLFSALILMLGTLALAGCQSSTASAPEAAQPAAQANEMNEQTCCKHDGSCDRACHQECKKKHIHCAHKAACNKHHHHHKAKTTTKAAAGETTQTTGSQSTTETQSTTTQTTGQ